MSERSITVHTGDPIPVLTSTHKAVAAGTVATLMGFLSPLAVAIDNGVTAGEWVTITISTVAGFAAGFGITYATPTKVK